MSTTETKIQQNRVYARDLGWSPAEIGVGATDFNALLVTLIAAQQQAIGSVVVDGVCGPQTYRQILAHRQAELLVASGRSGDRLQIAGQIAVLEAKRAWLTDIQDLPPKSAADYERCRSFIDDLIRSPAGINWRWEEPYHQGAFQYCGAFVAYALAAAGLKLALREKFFSSTYRLDRYGRYAPIDDTPAGKNVRPPSGPYRRIIEIDETSKPTDAFFGGTPDDRPRAGDIALVGPSGSAYGLHVTLVESYDVATGLFTTLEGNGTGYDPAGHYQHGIVRAKRPVGLQGGGHGTFHARRLIRISAQDLVQVGS